MAATVNTRRWTTPRNTYIWVSMTSGIGATIAYTGGSKMATGSTQTVMKSLVITPGAYAIRGVAATETRPQTSRSRNFHRSAACQVVWLAA